MNSFDKLSNKQIKQAVDALGVESLFGVSEVNVNEIENFISLLDEGEKFEIVNYCNK